MVEILAIYKGTQSASLINVEKGVQKQICEQLVRYIIKNVVNFGSQKWKYFLCIWWCRTFKLVGERNIYPHFEETEHYFGSNLMLLMKPLELE